MQKKTRTACEWHSQLDDSIGNTPTTVSWRVWGYEVGLGWRLASSGISLPNNVFSWLLSDFTGPFSRPKNPSKTCAPQGASPEGPTIESLAKLKHLLRYLAGTKGYVLRIKSTHMLSDWTSSIDIVCYVDSDWAGCSKTRKSTSGSTAQVLDFDVIHTSRTQATVALSSGEAELYAIRQGTSEALFLKSLILEVEFAKRVNMIVYTDSTAGRSMAVRFGAGKKTKHVELRYFYMQDLVRSGVLIVRKVHTSANPADVLTKCSPTEVLKNLTPKLGIVDTLHSADLFHLDR